MFRKSIAALLLLSMTAWAEVMVAPLFTIHGAHLLAAQTTATPHAGHRHAMVPAHACCPNLHKPAGTDPAFELKAGASPCEEQHRCCFLQGPQSTPSPATDDRKPSPETSENSALPDASLIAHHSGWSAIPALRPPPGSFGTVLRI